MRQYGPWLLVAVYVVQLLAIVHGVLWHVGRPLSGLYPYHAPGEQRAYALSTSAEAEAFRRDRTPELLQVNGRRVCETPAGPRCGVEWARDQLDLSPGATNRFLLKAAADGIEETVVFVAGPGELFAVLGWVWYGLVISTVGLIYAVVGLIVWRRNPADPAALPFLLFSMAVASMLGAHWHVDIFTEWSRHVMSLASWLVVPLMFLFTHSFATRSDASHTVRFRLLFVVFVVLGLAEAGGRILCSLGLWWLRPWVDGFPALLTVGAVASLTLSLQSTWAASRPPSPLSHRRRARVLAWAVAAGFGYPTLWVIFRAEIYASGYDQLAFWGLVLAFGSFPALIGYAMVRHRMFDLRIVMRQGLVYTSLSLALALAYVALVVGAYVMAGVRESTATPVLAVVVVAVLFGVVRVRLERWIDAMVFRGRKLLRRAIEVAGKALGQARRARDVAPTLQPALLTALGASRAYVLERDAEGMGAHCFEVGNGQDPETGTVPPGLPAHLSLEDNAAVRHCFERDRPVYSVDAAVPGGGDLWDQYGLELSVPFGAAEGHRPAGLLLVGPKTSGRPFDPEEVGLLEALGSQVAMALASARAFERLAESGQILLRLTQGIVHEVNTPLGVLGSSVDTLERAFGHMVDGEPERQRRAMRGARASIETVRSSSHRLKTLIGDLEAYINLEETERAPTDLVACLDEVTDDARRATGHPIELERPDGPAFVDGYPARLRHVFNGLLDNAIVATTNGAAVQIGLWLDGPFWRVTVIDEGCGMPPAVLARVFEFGIAKKRTQDRMGLRIGLPYARRVVESLGGRISIRSEVGAGTEVRIGLPALVS